MITVRDLPRLGREGNPGVGAVPGQCVPVRNAAGQTYQPGDAIGECHCVQGCEPVPTGKRGAGQWQCSDVCPDAGPEVWCEVTWLGEMLQQWEAPWGAVGNYQLSTQPYGPVCTCRTQPACRAVARAVG